MNDTPDQPEPPQQPAQSLPAFPAELQRTFVGQGKMDNGQIVGFQLQAMDHIGALLKLAAIMSDCPLRFSELALRDAGTSTGILSATGIPIHHGPSPRNRLRQ